MEHEELLDKVRALRAQRYTPAEIARWLGVSKADAARLVRVVACGREGKATAAAPSSPREAAAASHARCWVSPGWRNGLSIEGDHGWPQDDGAPAQASGSGVACVLVVVPAARDKLSTCCYLVDTWCMGVKNALGPRRMGRRELDAFRRQVFEQWESEGIPIPVGLAQHLVLGAVEYARSLGFEPHRDFRRARRLLGSWDGPSAITFGRDGKPCYVNGPYEDPEWALATLERTVGRDGFHFIVSVDDFDGLDDGYHYTVSVTDLDELGDAA